MTTKYNKLPWTEYDADHMNEHLAQHRRIQGKSYAFTCWDLEFCYIAGFSTDDFRKICENRIIRTLRGDKNHLNQTLGEKKKHKQDANLRKHEDYLNGIIIPEWINTRELGIVEGFENNNHDAPVHSTEMCYQAQNLVYMYALGLTEILDKDLIQLTGDTTVDNSGRPAGHKGVNGNVPLFTSMIGRKETILSDEVEDIRNEYLGKQVIAEEIRRHAKEYRVRIANTYLHKNYPLNQKNGLKRYFSFKN